MSFATAPVARILKERGEAMVLRRMTPGDPPTSTDVTVRGKRHAPTGETGDTLVGARVQKLLNVMISNAEIAAADWPGPPRTGDFLVIAGRDYALVEDADTRLDRGDIVCHFLLVQGG